jgi:ABC-type lipoprotein release transport system permease subunit
LRLFLLESFQMGVIGTCAGSLVGVGIAMLVNAARIHVPLSVQLFLMTDTISLSVHAGALVRSSILVTLITTLAALYPAYRAARLKPVSAMSHFG